MEQKDDKSLIPPPFKFPRGVKEVLSGTFAGIVGTVIGHPLDLVKVRLQTQSRYNGALDVLLKVVKEEGIRHGLFRGLIPPLISLTFLNSVSFGSYSLFKRKLTELREKQLGPRKETEKIRWEYFGAGLLTGTFSGVFSTPFEMVKVRMQLDNITERQYRGSAHCAASLYRTFGLKSWYTGYLTNTFRESLFCGVYFGAYEHSKYFLLHDVGVVSSLAVMISGGASGMIAWVVSFPLDCIKANIQGQNLHDRFQTQYKTGPSQSFSTVVKRLWATKGIGGFFSGVGPSVARAFVVSSTRFSAYEFAYDMLTKHVERIQIGT